MRFASIKMLIFGLIYINISGVRHLFEYVRELCFHLITDACTGITKFDAFCYLTKKNFRFTRLLNLDLPQCLVNTKNLFISI